MQFTSLSKRFIWTAAAVLAVSSQAQVQPAPGNMPGRRLPFPPPQVISKPPVATPQSPTAAQPAIHTGATAAPPPATPAKLPPSLLDKPPAPARVTLNNGSLSVDARDSSLSDILRNLEASSGMKVDGFDKDSRVFGIYGPGAPRDVLSSLLDGAGYNFLMVGSNSNGTPREIVLTVRSNAPLSAPPLGNGAQPDEEEEAPNYPPPEQVAPPVQQQPVMPPVQQRPRTPQEMLQELQRLRDQQQQQQQQGQPPQQ